MRFSSVVCCALLAFVPHVYGDEPNLPRPIAEQTLAIPKWEPCAITPRGSFESRGDDLRMFRFSPDGRTVWGMDSTCDQFLAIDVATGKVVRSFRFQMKDGPARFLAGAVSPDGRHLVTSAEGGIVQAWDLSGDPPQPRSLDEGMNSVYFRSVAFLNHRHCLLAGQDPQLHQRWMCIWDVETGEQRARFPVGRPERFSEPNLSGVAATPDGNSIALVESGSVFLRERSTGLPRRLIGYLPQPGRIDMAAFSHDGKILAVAHDANIHLFDVIQGIELPPLVAHRGHVRALHFTADGKRLQSLGDDNRLLTWNLDEVRPPLPAAKSPEPSEIADLIEQAGGDDAWQRFVALHRLSAQPAAALTALRKQLPPERPITAPEMDSILQSLRSENFNERKEATRLIDGRNLQVQMAIVQLQRRDPGRGGPEAQVLQWSQYQTAMQGTEEGQRAARRDARLLFSLIQLGTPEAQALLKDIAAGATESQRTKVAKRLLQECPEFHTPTEPVKRLALLGQFDPAPAWQVAVSYLKQWPASRAEVRKELLHLASLPKLGINDEEVQRLIKELDAEDFAQREKAGQRLAAMGHSIELQLRKARRSSPTPEIQTRLSAILKSLEWREIPPEERSAQRLLEVVVLAEGPKSELLQEVAKAAQSRWLRGEAEALLAQE